MTTVRDVTLRTVVASGVNLFPAASVIVALMRMLPSAKEDKSTDITQVPCAVTSTEAVRIVGVLAIVSSKVTTTDPPNSPVPLIWRLPELIWLMAELGGGEVMLAKVKVSTMEYVAAVLATLLQSSYA